MTDPNESFPKGNRGNKKDTKRWCKGRPGIKHTGVWQYWFGGYTPGDRQWERFVCVTCHKLLNLRTGVSNQPMKRDHR